MNSIAIIPARGGSKRIPRKNIKEFLGEPIIAYSITTALESNLFDEVMVSTDDVEIAEISKMYGAKVPFMRSAKNANDFATTVDVILEVLSRYEDSNIKFKYVCCIYATAPFVTIDLLNRAFDKMMEEELDTVFPIVPYSFPIQRAIKINNHGKIRMFQPEHMTTRSQDLESAYHDCGLFYWLDVDKLKRNEQLYSNNSGAITIDQLHVQDIDHDTDWKLAELKYNLHRNG